jgi:Predicted archaeal methyltransferase
MSIKIFLYHYKNLPILIRSVANEILINIKKGEKEFKVSLDLGLTFNILRNIGDRIYSEGGLSFPLNKIEEIVLYGKDDYIYIIERDEIKPLAGFEGGNFYKLRNVGLHAPTIEINGIHMHRIKGILPWEDARKKVQVLKLKRNDKVLDIGTGLGYTAIHAFFKKVRKVVSIEKDPVILRYAEYNPWSKWLENVNIIIGDAVKVLDKLEPYYFNKIIHDPPTFSISEELYSLDFYNMLHNLLPKRGTILHYVGYPSYVSKRKKIVENIISRCKKAGFTVKVLPEIFSILLYKS